MIPKLLLILTYHTKASLFILVIFWAFLLGRPCHFNEVNLKFTLQNQVLVGPGLWAATWIGRLGETSKCYKNKMSSWEITSDFWMIETHRNQVLNPRAQRKWKFLTTAFMITTEPRPTKGCRLLPHSIMCLKDLLMSFFPKAFNLLPPAKWLPHVCPLS